MMKGKASASNNDYIWTDNEQARYLLWDAYVGFVTHYNDWKMYESLNKSNPIVRAGLWKYAVFLYEESRYYAFLFKEQLEILDHQMDVIDNIFSHNLLFEDNNLLLIRRFFNDFLIISGLKNVIYKRDMRDNLGKLKDKYGISKNL